MRSLRTARNIYVGTCVSLIALILAGCSTAPSSHHGATIGPSASNANGTLISITQLKNVQYPSPVEVGERVFSMFYWSRGQRVQGYVLAPPENGTFPLYLELHGGYMLSWPFHHVGSSYQYDVTVKSALAGAVDNAIVFLPNYAGYGDSGGYVGDGYDNYVDTMNGLRALGQIKNIKIRPDGTYITGTSMGGYVAMKVAEHDPQVVAVCLASPNPGAIQFIAWLKRHNQSSLSTDDLGDLSYYESREGTNLGSLWYQQNSFTSDVHFPILILGGQQDPIIPPGMLSDMYRRLKQDDSNVQLDLAQGGHAPLNSRILGSDWENFFDVNGLQIGW